MRVEIWSDIVCPWCYIGKRRFETALAEFPHADKVEVVWRSFELDPDAPRRREGSLVDHLARKYGMSADQARASRDRLTDLAAEEGLEFRFDIAQPGNTFDAHRLVHLASDHGIQDAMKERFLAAYLNEGEPIGDPETLIRLAGEAGLDPDEARDIVDGDRYADDVRAEERDAVALGITGVPFFVIDRKYGVSGAQASSVLVDVLENAWREAHPLVIAGGGEACEDDSCAI
jgi:predicted DsbA family dithiol-disulfide isomerase